MYAFVSPESFSIMDTFANSASSHNPKSASLFASLDFSFRKSRIVDKKFEKDFPFEDRCQLEHYESAMTSLFARTWCNLKTQHTK